MGYIYCIHNIKNDKTYVGASTTDYLCQRKAKHIYDIKNDKNNSYLTEDWYKFGKNSFNWVILEDGLRKKELDDAERFWIKSLYSLVSQNGYNLDSGGYIRGYKRSQETIDKVVQANIGREVSELIRKRISESKKAMGWSPSKEHKQKMEAGVSKALSKKVKQYSKDGELIKIWDKRADACKKYGISSGSIPKVCRGAGNTAGGYVWRNIEDNFIL